MRVPFAIRATVLTGLAICAFGRPAYGSAASPAAAPPPAVPMACPPRDPGRRPPPDPVGTAVIRGRVVTSDTGNPVRRASVTLIPVPPPVPLAAGGTPAAATDHRVDVGATGSDAGRFGNERPPEVRHDRRAGRVRVHGAARRALTG